MGAQRQEVIPKTEKVEPLVIRSECGSIETTYTARGLPRYELDVRHEGLHKYQVVRGDNSYVVEQKAQAKMDEWDEMWNRRIEREQRTAAINDKYELATRRTFEATNALDLLGSILAQTLSVDDTVDWESLKNLRPYAKPKPIKSPAPAKPDPFQKPRKPSPADFAPKLGILDRIFQSRRTRKENDAQERLRIAGQKWKQDCANAVAAYNAEVNEYNARIKELAASHKKAIARWQKARSAYLHERDQTNAAIDVKRCEYEKGIPEAINDYCDIVLSTSQYPDYFPQSYQLEYNPENKILIVDYELPDIASLPTLKEVKYVKSRDDFTEKHISSKDLNNVYDYLLYQIALRTIHELYEADAIDALASIVFNGYVSSIDSATGQQVHPCILSVQANKDEFVEINLGAVDSKECFKKLKGVASSKLHSMTPVAPVLRISREDGRFIEGRTVVDGMAEGLNLAAMDWNDFEHLIRELFEKEFAQGGGEVKVTQASRDGGVDAIAFD